ncbi:MAG: outer membrane lipoprotein-sorting protein [Deltaproteobacteria bacterium]|nr:outer membrane lipoprotein-sorting protein [Deltaproteobacteria bacterium]
MKLAWLFVVLAGTFGGARHVCAAEPPPRLPEVKQVVDRLNDLYRADSSHARMTMKVVTERYRRELTLEAWTRGKDDALVVVRAPAREAGAATLRSEEGLWTYAPRADQLVRIPSSLLSDDWMGSHFTNDDLMRETDFLKDYDASLAWHEEGGQRLLQVTLAPKPKAPVVWSRVVFLLDPGDYMPLRADYFDGAKIVRTLSYADPHPLAGRRIPFTMVMVPTDKPGESTRVEYQDLKFGVKVDPSLFTQRGLRRVAKR